MTRRVILLVECDQSQLERRRQIAPTDEEFVKFLNTNMASNVPFKDEYWITGYFHTGSKKSIEEFYGISIEP